MEIIISGLHLKKSPKLEKYTREKVEKLKKYNSQILEIEVRLISEKSHRGQDNDYYCEINVKIPGRDLEIVDTERAMDKAIDKAVERMKRLIIKTKEKSITKKHRAGIITKITRGRFHR